MKSKKTFKPSKQDKDWHKKVEARIKTENVELTHLKGKERFEKIVRRSLKKGGASS